VVGAFVIVKSIKRKLDILFAVAEVTFKEWSAYRTHSMVSILVGPVYFLAQYFIWTAVYGNGAAINGFELSEMLRYFGISSLIVYLTMDFADWNLDMLIQTGKFLTFALRPLNHRFFALSQKFGHRLLGVIFEFIPCSVIFALLFKINLVPANLGWFVLSVFLAFLMNFYLNYCIGMFSFWLVRTDGIRAVCELIRNILSGTLIPLVFFPKSVQFLQFFLPFQYTSYVPSMIFLGKYTLGVVELSMPAIVGIQLAAVFVMFLISEIMYRVAMKRFTAVGA